ncbi:MAG: flagellin [Pseudomonadota bacterium]
MGQYSIGDLAQSSLLRLQSTRMRTDLLRLSQELSTGMVSDVALHLNGDLGYYADVEKNLVLLNGYDLAATEAGLFADATQSVLGRVATWLESSIQATLPASATAFQEARDQASVQALNDLEAIVAALNGTSGGRSLFAGTATDAVPMIAANTFIDTVKAALPAITDPASLASAVSDWFDDPTGFDATAYQGGVTDLAPAVVGENVSVGMGVRADADELKEVMEALTLAALATDTDYGFDPARQTEVFAAASTQMLAAQSSLTGLQANLGAAQERIETSAAHNAAARVSFETTRLSLIGADPFETATRLDDIQLRLESLYAVTARMSSLNLVNFI